MSPLARCVYHPVSLVTALGLGVRGAVQPHPLTCQVLEHRHQAGCFPELVSSLDRNMLGNTWHWYRDPPTPSPVQLALKRREH